PPPPPTALYPLSLHDALPIYSAAAWAVGALALLLSLFGPVVNLPQAVLDVSPFQHPPKIPGQEFVATPLVWLLAVAVVALVAGLDRKSTRLNSSHVSISYAVF